jgi:adenylate cyclase
MASERIERRLAAILAADVAGYSQVVLGWTEFTDRQLSRGADDARKAITLAPDQPDGYCTLGRILLVRAAYDQARSALKRAIEINPSDAYALAWSGSMQSFSGELAGAIDSLELAVKLDPMLEPNYVFRSGGHLLPCASPRGCLAHCRAWARAFS